jgi:hypothetical protein
LEVAHPPIPAAPRGPTPNEVFAAVRGLANCRYEFNRESDGCISIPLQDAAGRWTTAQLHEVTADDEPCELYFSKGYDELIVEVLRGCAPSCGPLVLIPESCDTPTVIF